MAAFHYPLEIGEVELLFGFFFLSIHSLKMDSEMTGKNIQTLLKF